MGKKVIKTSKNNQDKINFFNNLKESDLSQTCPEYSHSVSVNALSILRAIASREKRSDLCIVDCNEFSENKILGKKVFCKFFISLSKFNNIPLFFMLDSGSDISLINKNLIKRIFTKHEIEKYKKPCLISVESFSNHSIKLDYNIMIPCKFSLSQTSPIFLEFSVFSHQSAFPLLLGQDLMQVLGMELKFPALNRPGNPTVTINQPFFKHLHVRFIHPSESNSCFANIDLEPNQSQIITFQPHETSNVQKGHMFLVSESNLAGIYIFPTRCTAFALHDQPLAAQVINLRNQRFVGKLKGKVESLEDSDIINDLNDISNPPGSRTVVQEVLNFENHIPFSPMKQIKLLEQLPDAGQPIIPLTSFLILTPYESNFNSSYANNPDQKISQPDNILKGLQNEQINLSSAENKDFEDKLQNLPFNIIQPSSPSNSYGELDDIPDNIKVPQGYDHPNLDTTIHDIVRLDTYDPSHQPYIKDIFIDKYPSVVSLHAYDIGSLSDSLGLYHIQIRPGETLPKFRKVYYLAQEEREHMRSILDFLEKYKIIERVPADDRGHDLIASPCYLVGKKDKSQSYRMVIDYRIVNKVISSPVPLIPDINPTLHTLHNQALFTLFDLSSAYYSLSVTKESQHITTFACPLGKYVFKKCPFGLKSMPALFQEIALKMLHYAPVLGPDNNPVFTKPNHMKLEWDPIPQTTLFFDDLLIYSPLESTFELTLSKHFQLVEKVIQRLALHKAKISFHKSVFAQSKIKYLGWIISNNCIEPDPQRVDKLLNASFPANQKAMRSFCALLNTIKMVSPHVLMKPLKTLLPLTGSNVKYDPKPVHHAAFEEMKILLTKTPLFSNIIDPKLPKILFTDASASKGACFSAVLGQVRTLSSDKLVVPHYLSLNDPVHAIIYDKRLCFQPCNIYFYDTFIPKSELPKPKSKPSPIPDLSYLQCPYLGYAKETVNDSLFISIRSIQYVYQCSFLTISHMRKITIQRATDSLIIKQKILQNQFNNNLNDYKLFTNNFLSQGPLDNDLELLNALAMSLYRTIIVVSSLKQHSENPILKFNPHVEKPPFILGLYCKSETLIFRPYFIDKNSDFDLKQLEKFQIVHFWSKIIPDNYMTKSILELELMALLLALNGLDKLIGKSELLAITDSKSLFLLFANPLHKSSTKIARWSDKLYSDYPNLKLRFLNTKLNIADYLSRDFSMDNTDIKRIPFKNYTVPELDEHLDFSKSFSLPEWKEFVNSNLHLLKVVSVEPTNKVVLSLNKTVQDMNKLLEPVNALKKRISFANIALQQNLQFNQIIVDCIKSKDQSTHFENKLYKFQDGLLYCSDQGIQRIVVPKSLEGLMIAHFHLAYGHAGLAKMSALMFIYYFPQKLQKIKNLAARCYSCALNNMNNKKHKSGMYPLPENVFTTVFADLAENLNTSGGFQHLLILVCGLSGFIRVYPLKSKSSEKILFHIIYDLFQYFSIKFFISDNAPCFSEKHFLTTLQILGIKKIQIASLSPTSNAIAERSVGIVKKLLKKTLTTFDTYNWNTILPIVIKQFNSTVCIKTNYSPLTMLHGLNSIHNHSDLTKPLPSKLYPLLENHKSYVEQKFKEKEIILKFVKESLYDQKVATQEKFDKNKLSHEFQKGDYVFLKDTKITLGAPRPLRSYYSSDPYVVLQVKHTTLLLQRLADGFQSIYNMNLVKKYSPLSADFSDLPQDIREILVHTFDKLDKLHFEKLRELGSLDHPSGNILDYELLAENQDEDLNNENAIYPSDQTPLLESKNENDNIVNLDDTPPAELKSTQNSKPVEDLKPAEHLSESSKTKKSKSKVPPLTIRTRSAAIESDSESDPETKKVSFNTVQ